MDTVLAPAHFISDPNYREWVGIDRDACLHLRRALDDGGGAHIAIDYPLIVSNTDLNDQGVRGTLIDSIADLPAENIWLRTSGMGAEAGPLTMRRYLSAVAALHNLGRPIIADHLSGLTGMAAVAFGAVSGVAHGIAERERFDASGWAKPPAPRDPDADFGRAVRVWIPSLNKSATVKELELLATARNGRRLLGCGDRHCCHGLEDMLSDPRRHAAYQAFREIRELQAVPDLRREHHFLAGPMAEADRVARQIKQLRPSAAEAEMREIDLDGLMRRLHDHSRKTEKLRTTLEALHEARTDESPRARPVSRDKAAHVRKKEEGR